jgi:creatinine amidohydrolase/Fe(II)-dependent formamide hydrolase-like protein
MAATNAAAGGRTPVVTFPPRGKEIQGNVTAAEFCHAGKEQFHAMAQYMDALATALEADLTEMLRQNGIDGQTTLGPLSFGSDARKAAKKAVKALRVIAAEADNIARSFNVADRDMKRYVFDVIQQVIEARERSNRGAGMKMGA